MVAIFDVRGLITYISPSCARVLGGTPESFVGNYGFANVHPDDLNQARSAFARTVRGAGGSQQRMELRIADSVGDFRIIEVTTHNLLENSAVAVHCGQLARRH